MSQPVKRFLLLLIVILILAGGGYLTWRLWSHGPVPVATPSVLEGLQSGVRSLTADEVEQRLRESVKPGAVIITVDKNRVRFVGVTTLNNRWRFEITKINETPVAGWAKINGSGNWQVELPVLNFKSGSNQVEWRASDVAEGSGEFQITDPLVYFYDITLPEITALKVNWSKNPQALSAKEFPIWLGLTGDAAKKLAPEGSTNWEHLVVGEVQGGKYAHYSVLSSLVVCGLGCSHGIILADRSTHNVIILTAHGDRLEGDGNPWASIAERDSSVIVPDAIAPITLELVSPRVTLTNLSFFAAQSIALADFTDRAAIGNTVDRRVVYTKAQEPDGCFYIILPTQQVFRYQMAIPFHDQERIPRLTWADGTYNTSDYQPYRAGGCGRAGCLALRTDKEVGNRLVINGKTITGNDIYTLKDSNDKELKELYDQWYVFNEQKSTYEDFVKRRPIFYWKDPLGRWVSWVRTDVLPQAECGKPVIYLYPTKPTALAVKLNFDGKITKSIPEYENGWQVQALPDGTLTNLADGQTYPYLYWDGVGPTYPTQKEGSVVAAAEVESFLQTSLATLGLTKKEAVDFREFWTPILQRSPYVRVSFVDQPAWEKAAPLSVAPRPDHVLRIFMDWQPLNAPISIAPQVLKSPAPRTGFTVVEWGGLLY